MNVAITRGGGRLKIIRRGFISPQLHCYPNEAHLEFQEQKGALKPRILCKAGGVRKTTCLNNQHWNDLFQKWIKLKGNVEARVVAVTATSACGLCQATTTLVASNGHGFEA